MGEAWDDLRLSFKARALLAEMIRRMDEDGRLPSQEELATYAKDALTSVKSGWRELEQAGYIWLHKWRAGGRHYSATRLRTGSTVPGVRGASSTGSTERTSPLKATSSPTDSQNDDVTQSVLRTDEPARGAASQEGARVTIGALPEDDEPIEVSKPRNRRAPEPESESAGIGDLPKERGRPGRPTSATVAAKYGAKPSRGGYVDKRSEKAPEKYSIPDLQAEFGDRVREHVKAKHQDHTNHAAFNRNLSAWRRSNVSPTTILAAMDLFFADRRNLHTHTDDRPMWLKFVIFFQQHQGQASKKASRASSAPRLNGDSPILGKVQW